MAQSMLLTRFEQETGHLAQEEVDTVFGFMCDITTKMSSQDAVPSGVVLLVNFLLNKEGKKEKEEGREGMGAERERERAQSHESAISTYQLSLAFGVLGNEGQNTNQIVIVSLTNLCYALDIAFGPDLLRIPMRPRAGSIVQGYPRVGEDSLEEFWTVTNQTMSTHLPACSS